MAKPVLLSGIKPSGRTHLGNYFGALRQFVEFQNEYESYFLIPDLHALNFIQDPKEMNELSLNMAMDYAALGLAPEHIFRQSAVRAHTELAWIFETLTPLPYLKRAHAYKDAVAKNEEDKFSVGDFNYPMLMAADILCYNADFVPIGKDQQQHLEYARDTAERFNRIYGETFVLPKAHIVEDVAVVPGTDGRKMSKSYGNTIPLFATHEEIKKAVMSIVTGTGGDIPENVLAIHSLFRPVAELQPLYKENVQNYKKLKDMLVEDIEAFVAPLREKRAHLAENPQSVKESLAVGAARARERANKTMATVRQRVGISE